MTLSVYTQWNNSIRGKLFTQLSILDSMFRSLFKKNILIVMIRWWYVIRVTSFTYVYLSNDFMFVFWLTSIRVQVRSNKYILLYLFLGKLIVFSSNLGIRFHIFYIYFWDKYIYTFRVLKLLIVRLVVWHRSYIVTRLIFSTCF